MPINRIISNDSSSPEIPIISKKFPEEICIKLPDGQGIIHIGRESYNENGEIDYTKLDDLWIEQRVYKHSEKSLEDGSKFLKIVQIHDGMNVEKIARLQKEGRLFLVENSSEGVKIKAEEALKEKLSRHTFTHLEIKLPKGKTITLETNIKIYTLTKSESKYLNNSVSNLILAIKLAKIKNKEKFENNVVNKNEEKLSLPYESKSSNVSVEIKHFKLKPSDFLIPVGSKLYRILQKNIAQLNALRSHKKNEKNEIDREERELKHRIRHDEDKKWDLKQNIKKSDDLKSDINKNK